MKTLKMYKGLSVTYKLIVVETKHYYIVKREIGKLKTIEFESENGGKADEFFRNQVMNLVK